MTSEATEFDHSPNATDEEEAAAARKSGRSKRESRKRPADTEPVTFPYKFLPIEDQYVSMSPDDLFPAPFDSRATPVSIKDPAFIQLKQAISSQGKVLQPVVATPITTPEGESKLMLIAGRRRTRACKELGLQVPVHIMQMDLQRALLACGQENISQKSLSFYDQAVYYSTLLNEHRLEQKDIAKQLGVTDSQISQYLMVFDTCDVVQRLIKDSELAGTAARYLPKVKDEEQQARIAQKAVEKSWTLKQIEEEVDKFIAREKAAKAGASTDNATPPAAPKKDPTEDYKPEEIHPLKKNQFVALANLAKRKLYKAEEDMPDEYTSDETVESFGKMKYAQGFADALKLATGIKPLPKSLTKEDAEN